MGATTGVCVHGSCEGIKIILGQRERGGAGSPPPLGRDSKQPRIVSSRYVFNTSIVRANNSREGRDRGPGYDRKPKSTPRSDLGRERGGSGELKLTVDDGIPPVGFPSTGPAACAGQKNKHLPT